jgi:recombination protein RecA
MSQALRKLTGIISKSSTSLIFINQIRMKIGVMFGNPETTTGGNALKFYCSVRLEVRRIETLTRGSDEAIGNRVRVKVVKNKVAPPFKKVELEIIFGKGISASASLLDAAVRYDLISKSGSWYSYGEDRIGQGRDNAKEFLEQNPEVYQELETKVRDLMFPKPEKSEEAEEEAESAEETEAAPRETKSKKAAADAEEEGLF